MSVLTREDVRKPLERTPERSTLEEREPLRLYTVVLVALMMVLFTIVIVTLGDQTGAALVVGIAGLVLLGAIQMVVLRRKLFAPSTVAEIITALVGADGLQKIATGKGDEAAKPADRVQA